MDASQVYGSTQQLSNVLRGKKGYLDVRPFIDFGRDKVLPPDFETFCRSDNPEEEPCFLAGDVRSNENHGKRLSYYSQWTASNARMILATLVVTIVVSMCLNLFAINHKNIQTYI